MLSAQVETIGQSDPPPISVPGTPTLPTNPPPGKPYVSISGTVGTGDDADKATFTVSRYGDTSDDLTVDLFGAAGSAADDYVNDMPSSVTIPAGQSSKIFDVSVDAGIQSTPNIIATLKASSAYWLTAAFMAEVQLQARAYTVEDLAEIMYGETSSYRPQYKPNVEQTIANYDPASVQKLLEGREMLGYTAVNRAQQLGLFQGVNHNAPTAAELALDYVQWTWNQCMQAAQVVITARNAGQDPSRGATHYLLRQGGSDTNGGQPARPAWAPAGRKADFSYGPFRKVGAGGDVPAGDSAWIDIFVGIR